MSSKPNAHSSKPTEQQRKKYTNKQMGHIYLYFGDGAGKTTNALGLALRSLGHGRSVLMVQWMKGWPKTGEFKFQKKVRGYKVKQFGTVGWVDLVNPSAKDRKLAQKGLEFARKTLRSKKPPKLLILDELGFAAHIGLVGTKDVLALLHKIPKNTDIVITGRKVPPALIRKADFVNEIKLVKMPKKIVTTP